MPVRGYLSFGTIIPSELLKYSVRKIGANLDDV
jgi:hypothetical protein